MITSPRTQGYTLMELALVLAILGVILAGGLALYQQRSEAIKKEKTQQKLAIIDQALKDFFASNRFLPCPANANTVEAGGGFGVAVAYNPATHLCPNPQADPNDAKGMVPVRTLGLADDLAYDGWGRRFTYQLSSWMGTELDFEDEENAKGAIDVYNPQGIRLTHAEYKAAYVLISHGSNGFYSWSKAGAYIPGTAAINASIENYNASGADMAFMIGDFARDFDDVGLYRTKAEVYLQPRRVHRLEFRNDVCATARTLVSGTSSINAAIASYSGAYAAHAAALLRAAQVADELCRYGYINLGNELCVPNLLWMDENGYQNNGVEADKRLFTDCWCPGDDDDEAAILGGGITRNTDFYTHLYGQCE